MKSHSNTWIMVFHPRDHQIKTSDKTRSGIIQEFSKTIIADMYQVTWRVIPVSTKFREDEASDSCAPSPPPILDSMILKDSGKRIDAEQFIRRP